MTTKRTQKFPLYGWLGLVITIISWAANWYLPGIRTSYFFFPLTAGYTMFVDAWALSRGGQSIFVRKKNLVPFLLLASVPSWWLFEILNLRLQNWVYLGVESLSPAAYILSMSVAFSTVMPAIFSSANLMYTFEWVRNIRLNVKISKDKPTLTKLFITGWVMLALLLIWPKYFYPCVWICVILIIEPLNVYLGFPSILDHLSEGDWKPVWALFAGGVVCGFFWEVCNYYSNPKWIYEIPFVGFLHIFEMPLLGYGGYMPFALELFAAYNLMAGVLSVPATFHYRDRHHEQVRVRDMAI